MATIEAMEPEPTGSENVTAFSQNTRIHMNTYLFGNLLLQPFCSPSYATQSSRRTQLKDANAVCHSSQESV